MTRKYDSTTEQDFYLDAPVTLTPDQIADVAGGAALAATSAICPPIIFGFIGGPLDAGPMTTL
jgi:hypothetical protein